MRRLEYSKVINKPPSKSAFIFFHGWKGNKSSFLNLSTILDIKDIDWYFPEAPYSLENDDQKSWAYESSPGVFEIEESKRLIDLFIEEIIKPRYSLSNVYIMGFSQGAAVCYELFLDGRYHWGGIFPVGGFLRNTHQLINLNKEQKSIPIVIGHGIKDDIIPIEISEKIYKKLLDKSANINFIKYNGSHKISIDYLKKIKSYINGI
tara:strand:- start:2138 stop:2755 length:618 start_codon:yes stop_codon:yes gene_type:complete